MKYHLKNKISKREIRKQGKQPIPLSLMRADNDKHNRDGIHRGGNSKDTIDCQDIPLPTYDGDRP
jgi:hypothetical protein